MSKSEASQTIDATPRTAFKAAPTRRRSLRAQARDERKQARALEDERLEQEARQRAEERRARRTQAREERKARNASMREANSGRLTFGKSLIFALVMAVLAVAIIYPSARQFYITERNNERLATELAVIEQRNDVISNQIEVLSTDEGVADAARAELGWVKEGEKAVVVTGIGNDSTSMPATVNTSTIAAPTSPLTRVLDIIFFTDTSKPVVVDSLSGDNTGGSASSQIVSN